MKTPAQKENDLYRFYFWNGCKKQTLDRKVLLVSPTFSVVNPHNI